MQHAGAQAEHVVQQENGHEPVRRLAAIGVRGAK
jgi:hypothetical protein